MLRLRKPEIFLGTEICPVPLKNFGCIFPRNLNGAVSAPRIHHNDFIGPPNALEALTNIVFFIKGNDDDGNFSV